MRELSNQKVAWLCVAIAVVVTPARAQEVGVAAHVGTLGLGADVAVTAHRNVGLRAGGNFFPFDIDITSSDIEYSLDLPSPQFLLLLDVYPSGAFRVSGGLMISSTDFDVTAKLVEPVDIGGTIYTPDELGNFTGTIDTWNLSPYVGIGIGNPAASRVGFFLDLGVAFHGEPEVSAFVDGPVASLPGFQEDLAAEVQDFQDDVDGFTVYPVLSIGVSFGLGR